MPRLKSTDSPCAIDYQGKLRMDSLCHFAILSELLRQSDSVISSSTFLVLISSSRNLAWNAASLTEAIVEFTGALLMRIPNRKSFDPSTLLKSFQVRNQSS